MGAIIALLVIAAVVGCPTISDEVKIAVVIAIALVLIFWALIAYNQQKCNPHPYINDYTG